MNRNRPSIPLLLTVLALCLLTACGGKTAYHHYQHTPLTGWEKSDTLKFCVGPVAESGTYREEISLRLLQGQYPFMSLQLTANQTIFPLGHQRRDTLTCSLIDPSGQAKGDGISHYQYSFHLTTLELNQGDSLHISIRHNMKRETLLGITDVGVKLTKQ